MIHYRKITDISLVTDTISIYLPTSTIILYYYAPNEHYNNGI